MLDNGSPRPVDSSLRLLENRSCFQARALRLRFRLRQSAKYQILGGTPIYTFLRTPIPKAQTLKAPTEMPRPSLKERAEQRF